jgi:hypothetical protein
MYPAANPNWKFPMRQTSALPIGRAAKNLKRSF